MKFRTKFEVVQQKQFLSALVANPSKSDFCNVNWVAFSEEIRQVYSREILSNTATIRAVNSTEIDSVWSKIVQRETQNYAPLQRRAADSQTNFQNKILVEFTYGDFGLPLQSKGEQK